MTDLRALVEEALPAQLPGARVAPDEDEILVPLPDGRARVSLAPLLRRCRDEPRQIWPHLLADWLADLRGQLPPSVAADEAGPIPLDRLRLRLTPGADAESSGFLALPFGDHFTAAVVVDRPGRLDLLTLTQAEQLGREPDELVRLAVRQTVQHELATLDVRDHELPAGGSVRLLAADGNPYVTTALMSVPRFLPEAGEYGALVAAPRYSAVLLHQVGADLRDTAVAFDRVTRSMFDAADDRCTDRIFWWHDRVFHPVRVLPGTDGGPAELRVPPALAPLADRLGL
ncbi:hypothetical protein [Micromonospora auratinigra]|nr:hypothetical protein [Micromonospora auratinigra]